MDPSSPARMHYFVNESGDPNFLGRGKKDLIASGDASSYFIVGYLELEDLGALSRRLGEIREEIYGTYSTKAKPITKERFDGGQ